MKNIIVGLGEILWDILPGGKVLGGAPTNFAFHVSQFGFKGIPVSAIGNDENGKEIIDVLNSKNMEHLIIQTDFSTGTVAVHLDENGIPQYEICENVAWDNIPFTEEMNKLASEAQAVCFGSLAQRNSVSRETINHFLDHLPKNALIIFDINLRQHFYNKVIIENSLHRCNILKINDEEVVMVAKLLDLKEMIESEICLYLLKKYSLKMVVLTKGTEGSYVFSSNEISFQPTPKVKVADTVGAGDSFTGAFVASLLKGKSISEAHQTAVKVSAFVCTQNGATPQLPALLIE